MVLLRFHSVGVFFWFVALFEEQIVVKVSWEGFHDFLWNIVKSRRLSLASFMRLTKLGAIILDTYALACESNYPCRSLVVQWNNLWLLLCTSNTEEMFFMSMWIACLSIHACWCIYAILATFHDTTPHLMVPMQWCIWSISMIMRNIFNNFPSSCLSRSSNQVRPWQLSGKIWYPLIMMGRGGGTFPVVNVSLGHFFMLFLKSFNMLFSNKEY